MFSSSVSRGGENEASRPVRLFGANFLCTSASSSAVTGHFARGRVVPAMPTRQDIIVLDNGGSTIQVGFAGDETPPLYVRLPSPRSRRT